MVGLQSRELIGWCWGYTSLSVASTCTFIVTSLDCHLISFSYSWHCFQHTYKHFKLSQDWTSSLTVMVKWRLGLIIMSQIVMVTFLQLLMVLSTSQIPYLSESIAALLQCHITWMKGGGGRCRGEDAFLVKLGYSWYWQSAVKIWFLDWQVLHRNEELVWSLLCRVCNR